MQYYHDGKDVLVLAKTNIAVDNVLEKLIAENVRALRTGNNIETKSDLPYAYTVSTSNPTYISLLEGKNSIVLGTPFGYYQEIYQKTTLIYSSSMKPLKWMYRKHCLAYSFLINAL